MDNPDEGAPVIHSIKPDSVLIDQIQVGDRLIGVDEVDVSALSPVKVSKLISRRSTNPLRKLTLTRRTEADDRDLLSYTNKSGGDNNSNVDSMSRMSDMESGVDGMSRMTGIDTDADDDDEDDKQMFSSDEETSFVASMSRMGGDTADMDSKDQASVDS